MAAWRSENLSKSNSMGMRATAIGAIFRKVLRVRADTLTAAGLPTGQLINVMSNDVERLWLILMLNALWACPLLLVMAAVIGWQYIGPSILCGVGLMVVMVPVQMTYGKCFGRLRKETAATTDKRITSMKDVLHCMQGVKAAGWEAPFSAIIAGLRRAETQLITKTYYLKSLNISYFFGATALCSFVSIIAYATIGGGVLTPDKVFSTIAIFNALRIPVMGMLPGGIQLLNELMVVAKRIREILDLSESSNRLSTVEDGDAGALPGKNLRDYAQGDRWGLAVSGLGCGWPTSDGSAAQTLFERLTFSVNFGELAVIMGPVGSGKSTMLQTILGEVAPRCGRITVRPGTATVYSPQQPWVFPGSVRDNIVFGNSFDVDTYHLTIDACCLTTDLLLFDNGDETEIGERGITLSGGQKARLSLARTVYAALIQPHPTVVLLDDPFAAVDSKVGRRIYERAVRGVLSEHAVVLVTHHTQYSKNAHHQVTLGGLASGSDRSEYAQPRSPARMSSGQGASTAQLDDHARLTEAEDAQPDQRGVAIQDYDVSGSSTDDGPFSSKVDLEAAKTAALARADGTGTVADGVTEEARFEGKVSAKTYWNYLIADGATGGTMAVTALVLFLGVQGLQVAMDLLLADMTEISGNNDLRDEKLRQYGGLVGGFFSVLFIRSALYLRACIQSSRALHDRAFQGIMNSPLRFFDTQPVGRILNRFSKDVGYVDEMMPEVATDVLQLSLMAAASVVLICILDPWVLAAAGPCIALFIWLRGFYIKSSRELRRLEGTERSPLYAHLSLTVEGITTFFFHFRYAPPVVPSYCRLESD